MNIKQIMLLSLFLLFLYMPVSNAPLNYQIDRQRLSRRIKKVSIIAFSILLLIPLAFAQTPSDVTSWQNTGGNDGTFDGGEGFFANTGVNIDFRGGSVISPRKIPLIADLDNDSINEIIALDGTTIKIFRNLNLSGVTSIPTGFADPISNMIIHDIDSDGFLEIIISGQPTEQADKATEGFIKMFSFVNDTLILEQTLDWSNDPQFIGGINVGSNNEILIGCGAQNRCVFLHSTGDESSGDNLSMASFNATDISTGQKLDDAPATSSTWCFPQPRQVAVRDYDNTGSDSFIVSAGGFHEAADDVLNIYWLKVQPSGNIITAQNVSVPDFFDVVDGGGWAKCADPDGTTGSVAGQSYSSVTAHNFDLGSDSQSIIALMTAVDEWEMQAFTSLATFIKRFPSVFSAEGRLVSNVFRGNFYPDTIGQNADFCAAGYDEDGFELEITCGSFRTGESNDKFPFFEQSNTKRYQANVTIDFNVSQEYEDWHSVASSAEHNLDKFAPQDVGGSPQSLDEVVTPYGIFQLQFVDTNQCNDIGFCPLKEIFPNPRGQSASIISVDIDKDGFDELLVQAGLNIFIYQTLEIDLPAFLTDKLISTNPCLDQGALKINTTFSIEYTVTDGDFNENFRDDVDTKITFYAGSSNAFTLFSDGKKPSGFSFPCSNVILNQTSC